MSLYCPSFNGTLPGGASACHQAAIMLPVQWGLAEVTSRPLRVAVCDGFTQSRRNQSAPKQTTSQREDDRWTDQESTGFNSFCHFKHVFIHFIKLIRQSKINVLLV